MVRLLHISEETRQGVRDIKDDLRSQRDVAQPATVLETPMQALEMLDQLTEFCTKWENDGQFKTTMVSHFPLSFQICINYSD